MFESIDFFQLLTVILLAIGGYVLVLLKAGTEAAVKTTAEEAAKATIEKLKWPGELARELQKTRGIERQELRYKSYGALWKELRPLAIYDDRAISKNEAKDLCNALSNWYFSEYGGLLLTSQARDYYFALQDLLRITSEVSDNWSVVRPKKPGKFEQDIFGEVLKLKAKNVSEAIGAWEYITSNSPEDWQTKAAGQAKMWRTSIQNIAVAWNELDDRQRFAILQQVGSVLRTGLVNDLESRAR